MKKTIKILALSIAFFILTACASLQPMKDRYGNPVPQEVEFQCKSSCGFYDPRGGIMGPAMCMADCLRSKGY